MSASVSKQRSKKDWRAAARDAAADAVRQAFAPRDPQPLVRLRDFVRDGWHVVDPGLEVLWNWHVDAVSDHLEAVSRGEIQRLIINIPPGHAKSIIVAVMWPAWMWTFKPEWRALFSSYALGLAIRDSTRCRDVVESEWYRETFAPTWELKSDQNVKSYFANTRQGFRFSHSVGGQTTGYRGDAIVCDDPLNAQKRHSVKAREGVIDWWDRAMSSRLNDKRKGARVVIMQRLHQEDLTGHLIAKEAGYEHLCLPTKFEPERRARTFIMRGGEKLPFFEDPRTERHDLLFPSLFNEAVIAEAERELEEEGFSAQHQHNPMPAEGGMFKERFWRYWCYPGQKLPPVKVRLPDGTILEVEAVPLPAGFQRQVQSWDLTFKKGKKTDYVVGQVRGQLGANCYLLDQARDKMGFTESAEAIRTLTRRWPLAGEKYIENKANGPAVRDHLSAEIIGMVEVEPRGDKEERAWAVHPTVKGGNVYLPHPLIHPWVDGLKGEFSAFPNGTHDDQVDTATQALDQLANNPAPPPPATAGAQAAGSLYSYDPAQPSAPPPSPYGYR